MPGAFQPLDDNRGSKALPIWKSFLGVFLPGFVGFVCLDLLWLSVIAAKMYATELAEAGLQKPPRAWAAVGSWVCIVAAVHLFVLPLVPAVKPGRREYLAALLRGALMGLVLYGTVDLTNHAVLQHWSLLVTFVDLLWGTTACALSAVWLTALRGMWL